MHIFIYAKIKILRSVYIYTYKNPDTFQKARQFALHFIHKNPDTLRYTIFMKFLKLDYIYIFLKPNTLRYGKFFIYKKPETSKKGRQIALREVFIYKKPDILCYVIFHGIFGIFVGGGGGL